MKKFLTIVLIGFTVGACGSRSDSSTTTDSASADRAPFSDEGDSVVVTPADVPEITASVDRLIEEQEGNSDSYYKLRLSVSGYEYKTDGTWSFDSSLNLVHCSQEWASEGIEGRSTHVFRRERLYAVREENDYDARKDVEIFHLELGGDSYTGSESATDTVFQPLNRKFLIDNEQTMKTQLQQIIQLLKDNRPVISSDDPAELHLENNSDDEEMPGTEITDITVDRALLEELLK